MVRPLQSRQRMKALFTLISLFCLAGCGFAKSEQTKDKSVNCVLFPTSCVTKKGADCFQRAIQVAQVENMTSNNLNVEMSFKDMSNRGSRSTVQLQVPGGQKVAQQLGTEFSISKAGHYEDNGNRWVDPVCTPNAQEIPVKLGFTANSFGVVKNCRESTGVFTTGDHGGIELFSSRLITGSENCALPDQLQAQPE